MQAHHVAGRVAIVTGASSGIGAAAATAFATAGIAVVLAARRLDRLEALVEAIRAAGGRALAVATDVTDEAAVQHLFRAALDHFGSIDILVNNAGMADHSPTDTLSLARWRQIIDVNLTSAFLCSREAMRVMKAQGRGRIVHLGSLSAIVPRPHTIAYAASKFGLDGLNRSLAIDGRAHGVTSSIFHPGIVLTELRDGTGKTSLPPTGYIDAETAAGALLAMVDLPDHVNLFETVMLPSSMPFLGRG